MRAWTYRNPSICWALWNVWAIVCAVFAFRFWHTRQWFFLGTNVFCLVYACHRSRYWWERS